jgi:glycopeptide antibiotics resistance protein
MRMLRKHIRLITWIYLVILVLGMVLPIGNNAESTLVNTYIIELRLDYLIHVAVFLPLISLLSLSLGTKTGLWVRVFLLGLIIVLFCEGVQMLLSYRTFNINDLLASGAGALIGVIPAIIIWKRFV